MALSPHQYPAQQAAELRSLDVPRTPLNSAESDYRLSRQFANQAISDRVPVQSALAERMLDEEHANVEARGEFVREFDPRILLIYTLWSSLVVGISLGVLIWRWNRTDCEFIKGFLTLYLLAYMAYVGAVIYNYFHFAQRRKTKTLMSALKAVFLVFWIIGHIFLFVKKPSDCDPGIWGVVLMLIILENIRVFFPCIVLCTACCWGPLLQRFIDASSVEGADDKQIKKLSTRVYELARTTSLGPAGAISDQDAKDDQCTICFEDYKSGDKLRILPCEHEYHAACVDQWLHINRTCPLCRKDIVTGKSKAAEPDLPSGAQSAGSDVPLRSEHAENVV